MERGEILAILNEAYFSGECHEKEVVTNLHRLLRRARVFVDVGASLGQYTFFANGAMKRGEVIAVEADPVRFDGLKDNCERWAASSTNTLRPVHAAAADVEGEIAFVVTDSNVSGGLFPHPAAQPDLRWREVRVRSVTLDRLLSGVQPDLVKVDVEGGEWRVLQGARRLLAEGRAKFLVELHGWRDPQNQTGAEDVLALMASYGYRPVDFYGRSLFVRRGSHWWWRARLLAFGRRLLGIARATVGGRGRLPESVKEASRPTFATLFSSR